MEYIPVGRRALDARITYMFLLTATRHSMASTKRVRVGVDPTKVFEKICSNVLHTFWGGDDRCFVHHIGTGSDRAAATFPDSIKSLCKNLSEGGTWKHGARSPGAGDGGVDLVVWRAFRDARPGNLVGFAQCKTGVHWRQHLGRLRPAGFCGNFMTEPLILEPRAIFMVPSRILHSVWDARMRESGAMLFDRCRIVEYSGLVDGTTLSEAKAWLDAALGSAGTIL